LGRFHHDSQFFLKNCTLGDSILNQPITYAYRNDVKDECVNGFRFYHHNLKSEHYNYGWLRDNLPADVKPE